MALEAVISTVTGSAFLIALSAFVKEYMHRKKLAAEVEGIQVGTDSKRIQIQDNIITSLQSQLIMAVERICVLESDRDIDKRRIAYLERTLIINGILYTEEPYGG